MREKIMIHFLVSWLNTIVVVDKVREFCHKISTAERKTRKVARDDVVKHTRAITYPLLQL